MILHSLTDALGSNLILESNWLFFLTYSRNLSNLAKDIIFRLDHEEGAFGTDAPLANLSKLMENSPVRFVALVLFPYLCLGACS